MNTRVSIGLDCDGLSEYAVDIAREMKTCAIDYIDGEWKYNASEDVECVDRVTRGDLNFSVI